MGSSENIRTIRKLVEHDLIRLCGPCHLVATTIRRYVRRGGGYFTIISQLNAFLEECITKLLSRESACFSTPAKSRLTTAMSGHEKLQSSTRRKEAIERKSNVRDIRRLETLSAIYWNPEKEEKEVYVSPRSFASDDSYGSKNFKTRSGRKARNDCGRMSSI